MPNHFNSCEKQLTLLEITSIEEYLNIKLPLEFKNHYLKFNGGTPKNTLWNKSIEVEVRDFMPIKYRNEFGDDPDFTLDGRAKDEWKKNEVPKSLLPFAIDWGGNYFCIGIQDEKIYFFVRDVWSDNISHEKNLEVNTKFLCNSFSEFIDGLIFNDEND